MQSWVWRDSHLSAMILSEGAWTRAFLEIFRAYFRLSGPAHLADRSMNLSQSHRNGQTAGIAEEMLGEPMQGLWKRERERAIIHKYLYFWEEGFFPYCQMILPCPQMGPTFVFLWSTDLTWVGHTSNNSLLSDVVQYRRQWLANGF